jgi:hypothetical protein
MSYANIAQIRNGLADARASGQDFCRRTISCWRKPRPVRPDQAGLALAEALS